MKRLVTILHQGRLATLLSSTWAIALLLVLITYVVLGAVLVLHHTSFFVNLDNVDQFYTWYQKLAVSVHHGYIPIWDVGVFGGQSFAGELQPGVFYPVNLIWVELFGSANGIAEGSLNYLVAVHFWFAAFGSYLLIKEMGARRWAAFLAGITFAFSGVVAFRSISQTVIFFGMSLLPYTLFFLVKYHNAKQKRWLVASGLALGWLLLAGHVEPFFHALLAIGLLECAYLRNSYESLAELPAQVAKSIKQVIIICLFAGLIAAPQIWISAPYLGDSYRVQANGYLGPGQKLTYADFSKAFNVDIHEFANLVDPVTYQIKDGSNIFIGLAPLAIIVLGWYVGARKLRASGVWEEHSFFITSLLVLSFVAMLGYATWFAVLLYEIPFVYQIRELGRYAILFDLALAMLLAVTLPVVSAIQVSKQQARNLLLAGCFLFINAIYIFALRHHIFSLHFALQTALLSLTLLTLVLVKSVKVRQLIFVCLILGTASVNTIWFLPSIKPNTETPVVYTKVDPKIVRILESTNGKYRVENNALPVNIGNVYQIQTTGGYAATIYAPYFRVKTQTQISKNLIDDLLGVKLVVDATPQKAKLPVYVSPGNKAYVYERASALPKMFTTTHVGSIRRSDYSGLPVTTLEYNDRKQTYSVETSQPERVIISEIYYPGWQASVNGKKVEIRDYKIGNYPLLKSIDLPAGTNIVQLTYRPFKVL